MNLNNKLGINRPALLIFTVLIGLNASPAYSKEPLPSKILFKVSRLISSSLIELSNGEKVKLIGIQSLVGEEDKLFLSELKEYVAWPYSLVYLEYDPKYEGSDHRDAEGNILAYVFPQSMVGMPFGEIKVLNGQPKHIVPASPSENIADMFHMADFAMKQGAALRATNTQEVLKGAEPNSFAKAGIDELVKMQGQLINQHAEGKTASPGKAIFLNATVIRSGYGFADTKSEYKYKKEFLDYEKGAIKQKLRVHNSEEINKRKMAREENFKDKPLDNAVQPKVDSKLEENKVKPSKALTLNSIDDSRQKMRGSFGFSEDKNLNDYYEELGIKK